MILNSEEYASPDRVNNIISEYLGEKIQRYLHLHDVGRGKTVGLTSLLRKNISSGYCQVQPQLQLQLWLRLALIPISPPNHP